MSPQACLPADGQKAAIDPESIAELRGLEEDGEGILPRPVHMFREDGPQALADLRVALASDDAVAVARIAHTVKGSAGYFGAYRFQELCGAIELAGKAGDLAGVAGLLDAVGRELSRVLAALESALTREPS